MASTAPGWLCRTLSFACLLAACGDEKGAPGQGPCARYEVFGCGKACSSEAICAPGLFCEAGACTAECTIGSVAENCPSGASCSADGRCVVASEDAGEPTRDGEDDARDAGSDDDDGGVCGAVELMPTPVVPNVLFLIDQSGSMADPFDRGQTTRWDALRNVLLSDDGLIAQLEGQVDFGVVLYTGDPVAGICPQLTSSSLTMRNLAAIRQVYEGATPSKDTPTGDAVEAVLASSELSAVRAEGRPLIFILATDGEPDRCEDPDSPAGAPREAARKESTDALAHAFEEGIRSYVIAVADEDEIADEHVQALANAGQGIEGAASYRVRRVDELAANLTGIVSEQVSCRVPLRGEVTADDPCVGSVELSGAALACNDPNGWHLEGDSTLVVDGEACAALKRGGRLTARFPCGTAIPL